MVIEKIMNKEAAQTEYEKICSELGVVDLDKICSEEGEDNNKRTKRLTQAIMCGLVKYDDDKKCLVQTLINPLKKGELTPREQLIYRNKLTMNDLSDIPEGQGIKSLRKMLNIVTACPNDLLNTMQGQDFEIALACLNFFE